MNPDGGLWQQRYKCEEILEVSCPKCGAEPHKWCDRADEKLSKRGRALLGSGTPPSHQERMWRRQGHADHEFAALLAKQRPGLWDESVPRSGKPASRPSPRGGCTPCATERKIREGLRSPLFPADFPCRHPQAGPVPPYPRRYVAERFCAACKMVCGAEAGMQSPGAVAYRCARCGGTWTAMSAITRTLVPAGNEEPPPWD